jgi:hypothetical protein
MTNLRTLSIAIGAVLLSACAANGLPYPEHPASSLVVTGVAKVTIFRSDDTLLYSARTARLMVDGERAGRLATGGFRTFKVEPGPHTFMVKMWDAPGVCELKVDIQPDVEYFYEVAPRPPTFAASTPGALLLGASPAGVLFGAGASTAESASKECDGAFSIVPVEPAQALPKVSALRASS